MQSKSKKVVSLLISGLVIATWSINFVSRTGAHEGHKRKNAPASAKKLKNPLKPTDEQITAGRLLYERNCASCHGGDGKATTRMAASMKVKPTDLTSKAMHGITDGEVYWVVTNGIKRAAMPAFKARTSSQQRWQIVLYVKHLMGEHAHVGKEFLNL